MLETRRIAMLIEEMTSQVSLDLLARTRLGRLACVKGRSLIVVPIHFAYRINPSIQFCGAPQPLDVEDYFSAGGAT
jgi:nitroimidazol reductase NimA-like FMN-containing flavoprotein (pyridoxamine 5'-phosphate oxidase superfamily)